MRHRLALAAACAALSACAGRTALPATALDDPATAAEQSQLTGATRLYVDNRSWLDVAVFAVSDGTRHRLGMVGAAASRSFTVPSEAMRRGSDLAFVADPVGSTPFTSERVLVQPGQNVHWTLESELQRSSLLVR